MATNNDGHTMDSDGHSNDGHNSDGLNNVAIDVIGLWPPLYRLLTIMDDIDMSAAIAKHSLLSVDMDACMYACMNIRIFEAKYLEGSVIIGIRARRTGGPLARAKPLFFGQKLNFSSKASSQKWKDIYNVVFIKRKKCNSFRLAR